MSVVPVRPRVAVPFVVLLLAALLAALAPLPAAQQEANAETPFAPASGTSAGGWTIEAALLIDKRDPDWQVAATSRRRHRRQLLEPERYVSSEIVIEDITKIYALMLEHCDLHMGFKLIPEGYPNWLALTRAYYETQYVFVARDPALHALSDLPPGRPIGATIGTSAHIRLVAYLMALPAEKRWPAFPFGTNDLTHESLRNGTVDVALVWAPSLWGKQRADPAYAQLHVIAPTPLPPTAMGVGAVVLAEQKFLPARRR